MPQVYGLPTLNWIATGVDNVAGLGPIDWEALTHYATEIKYRRDDTDVRVPCHLSLEYNMGGLHLIRRIDFRDGDRWVARIQLDDPAHSAESLVSEVHTMSLVRQQSDIPVPEVYAFETTGDNPVGVPFILMEFVPGDTLVDTAGGRAAYGGIARAQIISKLYASLADVQVQMSAIRFPHIGRLVKRADGGCDVGPLPHIGGPFNSAREFFQAWARRTAFPYPERLIRRRISSRYAEEVLKSIKYFPSRVADLTKSMNFRGAPFPLYHTDFYSSNIIVDPEYNILSVIDWEGAFIAPWELVEFAKDLSIIPPAMEIPPQTEGGVDHQRVLDRRDYVELTKGAEEPRGLDNCLSATLDDSVMQSLASAMRLYQDGRVGSYGAVLDAIEHSRLHDQSHHKLPAPNDLGKSQNY